MTLFTAATKPLPPLPLLDPTPFFSREVRESECKCKDSSPRPSKIENADTKIPESNEEPFVDDEEEDLGLELLDEQRLTLGEFEDELVPDDFAVPALSDKFFIT